MRIHFVTKVLILMSALVLLTAAVSAAGASIWRLPAGQFTCAAGEPEKKPFTPANTYTFEEFTEFFKRFSEEPAFQAANTAFPLTVFYLNPYEPGLHVTKTAYYTLPPSSTLFPTAEQRQPDRLSYELTLHKENGAVIMLEKSGRKIIYVSYTFLWNNGWYLAEMVDSAYQPHYKHWLSQ